ncbi:phosphotransferase [Clostridium paridis]|uniref:Phosphotransferase n=1 Tax=Clostridium paridis TaxID=2803863 RepID=A0A937FF04_9CLOT|nr:phosphotransferase [Clostridium paridis]MBL4932619.1 phosphotransferase [Clostridium paridis]
MDNTIFRILECINNERTLKQRDISKVLDISLGKVNMLLNELEKSNHISIVKDGKEYTYKLTTLGINELENYLSHQKDKKLNIQHKKEKNIIKKAIILAAGEKKNFEKPVCLMDLEDNKIIDRTINILRNLGIEEFIIVAGYQKEYFDEFEGNSSFKIVENDKYKWTGSMHSLMMAKEYINEDFLLIEDDLIIEERALQELLDNEKRDCMLITNESGSGDEAFVQIKEEHVFKLSKDMRMFNRIDGEMLGALKISIDVYEKMLNEMKSNMNPYINYEYVLMDVARNYNIGYAKVNDIVWTDIDKINDYENLIKRIYPLIARKELEFKEKNIKECIREAMNVEESDITNISPIGGMTNRNYKVSVKNEDYVLRMAGKGTEEMINRIDEKNNSSLAADLGIDSKLIYHNPDTGVKISKYIENADTLTAMTAKKEANMELVIGLLKKLHYSEIPIKNVFDPYVLIEKYEDLGKKYKGAFYEGYDEVKQKVLILKEILIENDVELKPCHNDTLPDNFVKSNSKMYLIDWEYSGLNDPMWDLAAHSLESGFNENEEELFLRLYFDGEPKEKYRKRILINKILQDFLWSIWTIIKEAKGDNFGSYGIDRFNRAKENLTRI